MRTQPFSLEGVAPIRPVSPEAPGLWRNLELVARFDHGHEPLFVTPQRVFTHGSTGNPVPAHSYGMRVTRFDGDDAYNGIPAASLPATFPGEIDTAFTALAYMRVTDFTAGVVHNTIQKDDATGQPYFLWINDDGTVSANISATGGTLSSTGSILVDQWALVGSRFDGTTNLDIIINGEVDISEAGHDLQVETTPLNIATRNDDTPNSTRSLRGDLAVIYIWSRSLSLLEMKQLGTDPFMPLRELEDGPFGFVAPAGGGSIVVLRRRREAA